MHAKFSWSIDGLVEVYILLAFDLLIVAICISYLELEGIIDA